MKNKKKLALVSMITATALSILSGCGSSGSNGGNEGSEANNSDQVHLKMAWWGSQARHDATVKVIELYEDQNPNVDIEYEFYDYDGYYTKLGTLAASESIWDIVQLDNQFPQYINQLEPLDEFVDNKIIDVSNTNEKYLSTTTYDNKLVGISNGVNSFALAYNKTLLDEAGIEEPTDDWTYEEFEKMNAEIKNKLDIYGVSRMDDFIHGAIMYVPQTEKGLNFYDKSNLSTTLGFDDPNILAPYFEMRKNMVDNGSYPELGGIDTNTDSAFQAIRDRKAAMVFIASNQLVELMKGMPEDQEIKLINPPRITKDGEAGIPLRSSQMLSISKNSKNKEEAAKFINFFQNDEEANKILAGERGVPIMENIREMLIKEGNPATLATFEYLEKVSELDNGEINVFDSSLNPEIQAQYNLIKEKVILGELTPNEGAQSIFDFATDILK